MNEHESSIFSWQRDDWNQITNFIISEDRVLLLHGRDFDSPYHVINALTPCLFQNGQVVFRICADPMCQFNSLFPFSQAVSQLRMRRKDSPSILSSVVKDISRSDALAAIVERVCNEQHCSIVLGQWENELLAQIEYAANERPTIFLFGGYHAFDSCSKNLTLLLLSGKLNEDYPFLMNAKYIFLHDTSEADGFPTEIERIEHIDIRLTEPTLNDVAEIIYEMNKTLSLQEDEAEKLFYLAGGRLSYIEILIHYLGSKNQLIADVSDSNVIKATMAEHLTQLGASGTQMSALLSIAASIGRTFSISLLKMVIENPNLCSTTLKKSDEEYFTICDQVTGRFALPAIWDFFFTYPSKTQREDISRKLAEAIYYFDPFDHLSRGRYYEQGGLIEEACEQYVLAFHSAFFDNAGCKEFKLAERVSSICDECGFSEFWSCLLEVYKLIEELNYEACVNRLESLDPPSTQRLLVLTEYLEGLCLHKAGRTHEQQTEAMAIMQSAANHAKGLEDSIWCDCQTALISLLMNIEGDIVKARQVMRELTFFYTQKKTAPYAQRGLHVLERKWAALYSAERALVKTENSVKFFENEQYPSQYIMALNNHAANLIVLGQYQEALVYLDQALELCNRFSTIRVNAAYWLNNYCIASVLAKRMSSKDAHHILKTVLQTTESGEWANILRLNDFIFLAQTGNLRDAEAGLQGLLKQGKELNDDYYIFYASANLAAVWFLQGERSKSIQILTESCRKAPKLFKETERKYLEDRTDRWIKIISVTDPPGPDKFDDLLLDLYPDETQGNFVGRGFLYSDIQFWTEA